MTVQAQNNLATNTLASDGGNQISQYYGHWALDQPDIGQGQCVQVYNIISTISIIDNICNICKIYYI